MEQQDVNNGGGNEKSMSEIIFPAIRGSESEFESQNT